ncbi:MAG: aspartate aminotransferase family protein [Thermoplasmata archaeon]|uniref:Glutamate-1-semialdehyde 2,1-aminomutase n=1 Tax=Candidatus Sysuiplasma superficiale TaxID=2823368 RepID=A0A8J7YS78_9ARCH|nr:aspartate aminotransferase family protein [Candidatus Sysuiplasma superficiale]MBX8643127.1 aspartate aminotransferase family protein [Candidatus Sysuiplasma superficiale]
MLGEENSKFLSRTVKSGNLWKESGLLTPFGVHSNYRFTRPYPLFAKRGRGSRIFDADGNEYIDFSLGYGALQSGHAHPEIISALKSRIEQSYMLGFEEEASIMAARAVNERYSTEMVRFSNTGTEATMHALRIARAFTGRDRVLKFEGCYHGSNSDLLFSVKPSADDAGSPLRPVTVPAGQGIPAKMKESVVVAPFNDIAATEDIVESFNGDFAAIILEPYPMNMGVVLPRKEFISGLRRLCSRYGILLLFDEVKTCGKFYGGAEEALGVRPDIKILGKAIGSGVPVSAIAGRKEIFERVGPGKVSHAGTFNSNPLSMEAVIVSLKKVLTREAISRSQKLSSELASASRDLLEMNEIVAHVPVAGVSGAISFNSRQPENWRDFMAGNTGKWNYYYLAMTNLGVIPAAPGPDEQWTVSVAHTEEDIDITVEAFKKVAPRISSHFRNIGIEESV